MWKSVVKSFADRTFKMSVLNIRRSKGVITENRSCYKCSGTNDEILVEKLGSITTIGINQPHKRNCINQATAAKLSQAILEFEEDDSAVVGVLHGIGGNFCAGYDLEELSGFGTDMKLDNKAGHGPMGPTRRMIKKPMVAAISGYAVAGGMELALMCDLRVMEETAVMGVFCRRFGLGQAINLATSLVKFPQGCMQADRVSAYNSAFSASSFEDALEFEKDNATPIVLQESVTGAKKFMSGVGRHGKFYNLTDTKEIQPVRSKI
ncbi:hypothetical protein B7P43_G11463 [Cryptotermes secundus]|uniref:Uncharacterized protein n=1 Tax=Cryptotermes secundus TaxID=105785 RepID=A0A2J7RA41_9NEOP|nr:hypothetical protein B7P43_G11463 [Cryptotermes secundus]